LREGWGDPEWLFPNEEGKPHDEARVRKVFKRALGKAKLPAFRLYDLRHTFASLLLSERAPITYVSAQLGHVNPATTLRYYARWIPNKGQRWVDLLDRVAKAATSVKDAVQAKLGTRFGTKQGRESVSGAPPARKAPEKIGGPSRTRTLDPLIKSHSRARTIGHHRAQSATMTRLERGWLVSIVRVASP